MKRREDAQLAQQNIDIGIPDRDSGNKSENSDPVPKFAHRALPEFPDRQKMRGPGIMRSAHPDRVTIRIE
jgi:hypothetical protein